MQSPNLIDSTITLGQLLMASSFIVGGAFTLLAVIFKHVLNNRDASAGHEKRLSLLEQQYENHDENAKIFREHVEGDMRSLLQSVGEMNNQLQRCLGKLESEAK